VLCPMTSLRGGSACSLYFYHPSRFFRPASRYQPALRRQRSICARIPSCNQISLKSWCSTLTYSMRLCHLHVNPWQTSPPSISHPLHLRSAHRRVWWRLVSPQTAHLPSILSLLLHPPQKLLCLRRRYFPQAHLLRVLRLDLVDYLKSGAYRMSSPLDAHRVSHPRDHSPDPLLRINLNQLRCLSLPLI
jgi:hypothetical protein